MPGKSLVVLDPALGLAIDIFPCEDGHAQERSLLSAVLETVEASDLWIGDGSVHGTDKVEGKLSYYYLADELEGTYRGMMIALPPEQWQDLRSLSLTQFSALLQDWAATVKLEAFTSTPRKPKKKKSKPPYDPAHPHVSTARLLAQKKKSRASPD